MKNGCAPQKRSAAVFFVSVAVAAVVEMLVGMLAIGDTGVNFAGTDTLLLALLFDHVGKHILDFLRVFDAQNVEFGGGNIRGTTVDRAQPQHPLSKRPFEREIAYPVQAYLFLLAGKEAGIDDQLFIRERISCEA